MKRTHFEKTLLPTFKPRFNLLAKLLTKLLNFEFLVRRSLRNTIEGKYICQFFEKVNGELLLQRQQVQGTVQATADLNDKFDFPPYQNLTSVCNLIWPMFND